MSHKLEQIGIMSVTDEEFEVLLNIFATFPENTMLSSAYLRLKSAFGSTIITYPMAKEMEKLSTTLEKKSPEYQIIDKILDFKRNATITIE